MIPVFCHIEDSEPGAQRESPTITNVTGMRPTLRDRLHFRKHMTYEK